MTYYYELQMTKHHMRTIWDGYLELDETFETTEQEVEHIEGLLLSKYADKMIEQNYEKIKVLFIDKILKST